MTSICMYIYIYICTWYMYCVFWHACVSLCVAYNHHPSWSLKCVLSNPQMIVVLAVARHGRYPRCHGCRDHDVTWAIRCCKMKWAVPRYSGLLAHKISGTLAPSSAWDNIMGQNHCCVVGGLGTWCPCTTTFSLFHEIADATTKWQYPRLQRVKMSSVRCKTGTCLRVLAMFKIFLKQRSVFEDAQACCSQIPASRCVRGWSPTICSLTNLALCHILFTCLPCNSSKVLRPNARFRLGSALNHPWSHEQCPGVIVVLGQFNSGYSMSQLQVLAVPEGHKLYTSIDPRSPQDVSRKVR